MKRLRLRVDAQVRAADVVDGVEEEELTVAAGALAPFCGNFSDGRQPSLSEHVVRGLLEGQVPPEGVDEDDEWDAEYRSVLKEFGLAVDPWCHKLTRLRVRNLAGFCTVWDVEGLRRPELWIDDDGDVTWAPSRSQDDVDAGPLYTLPVDFTVELVSNARTSLPKATQAGTALRPAARGDAAMEALAEHLRPRHEATFGGAQRLEQYGVRAPICAIGATVRAVMRHTARSHRGERIYRPEVLQACLSALDLGPCRVILERVLLRDHPEHLHVDTSGLPATIAPSDWRNALGMFARNDKGELVDVTVRARQQLLPRVLFSLSGPEPF